MEIARDFGEKDWYRTEEAGVALAQVIFLMWRARDAIFVGRDNHFFPANRSFPTCRPKQLT